MNAIWIKSLWAVLRRFSWDIRDEYTRRLEDDICARNKQINKLRTEIEDKDRLIEDLVGVGEELCGALDSGIAKATYATPDESTAMAAERIVLRGAKRFLADPKPLNNGGKS